MFSVYQSYADTRVENPEFRVQRDSSFHERLWNQWQAKAIEFTLQFRQNILEIPLL